MTGAILSGGENRRLPLLKGLLTVEGMTIIERTLEVLGTVLDRVVISTNSPQQYARFGVPMIGDLKMERGPLTGIFSVLVATGDDSVFVAACDMPFIKGELIRHIISSFERLGGSLRPESGDRPVDAVVPVFHGMTEPLFGVYSRNCIEVIEEMYMRGQKSIQEMLNRVNVFYVSEEEVREKDPEGRSFVNINTMEDYEKIGGAVCSG